MEDYDTLEEFVDQNREMLVRVLEHSSNEFARAAAWTLLDAGSDDPDIERLESELKTLQRMRKEGRGAA